MKKAFEGRETEHLGLHTDVSVSRATIDNYIYDKVTQIASDRSYDDGLRTSAIETLSKPCCGKYLWVDSVCTALRAKDVWHVERFLEGLESIKNLTGLYAHMRVQGYKSSYGGAATLLITERGLRNEISCSQAAHVTLHIKPFFAASLWGSQAVKQWEVVQP